MAAGTGIAFARGRSASIGSGVVVIETNLGYEGGQAAGTGMVLTSSGEVLTNNHVVNGATDLRVVVPGTGHVYDASVVGYSRQDDVAVIRLNGASHLKTIATDTSSNLAIGQAVTALGNAGGTGSLTPASGTITGLDQTITAGDENGQSEQLTGLIETNAAVEPGDSGGPLLDASGRVIGMDTAASLGAGSRDAVQQTTANDGYAIPIARALAIANQIEANRTSTAVHVGATAFLGVEIASASASGYGGDGAGAQIVGVVSGGPAAMAGLAPGDVIVALDGTSIDSPDALTLALQSDQPGSKVAVTYADQAGGSATVSVTLGAGPSR